MTRARFEYHVSAAMTLGLALILPITASAQAPSGPGLSSGSGEGTGTGLSSGIQRNQSGSISGSGPGNSLGGESGGLVPSTGSTRLQPPGFSVPLGPGATTTFPTDDNLFPFSTFSEEIGQTSPPGLSTVRPKELEFARSITDPGDRCLTLQRLASVAVFSNQLGLAHRALGEAAEAALQIADPVVHDLRIVAIITGLNNLSEALLRDGKMDLSIPDFNDDSASPLPKSSEKEPQTLIRKAELEWERGAHLVDRIINITYRTEMLYRIVDSQSFGSQTIVNEFPHSEIKDKPANDTAWLHPLDASADRVLIKASEYAQRITRPVWRDRALVAVANAAAQSKQYGRALQVARLIPQPEVRSDALIKIAESQARRNRPDEATATYHEAAEAVASIPLTDPRSILAGVLIDNLISVGRFEDARRVVILLPDDSRKLVALGAIAESQGFRGASETAVKWIINEIPVEHQPYIYRKLRFGMLAAIEQNRSRDMSNRER